MADASLIYAMVSTFTTDDERIRIPKLRRAENDRPWSIYVQATLESKGCWDIVIGTRKTPATPGTDTTDLVKKEHSEYIQSHATARSILLLSIDQSIPTDPPTTVQQIQLSRSGMHIPRSIKRNVLFFDSLFSFI